ncbi:MAG: hypothetical protein ACYC91_17890 [Solirubrobacteraceae bacterium]
MRKYARWPGLPTDLEHSRATGRRANRPRAPRDRIFAAREAAQLDDDQGAGPRLVVAADEFADRWGVWFGEQYAPE